MAAKKPLNIGIVGYGFMGRTHSNAYKRVNDFFDVEYRPVLKAVCGRTADGAKAFAEQLGLRVDRDRLAQAGRTQGYRRDRHLHAEQHARRDRDRRGRGRQDDPLREAPVDESRRGPEDGRRHREGRRAQHGLVQLPPRAGRDAGQATDRRRHGSGKIFHYRANFLQDWTISADLPQGGTGLWRLDVAAAGSGVTGDLLAHCIDTALWSTARSISVCAMTETFVKERKHNLTGKVEPVGIDDACAFLCRFGNGSLGLFESTRYARGHKALYTFEVNGEKASIKWDLRRPAPARVLRPSAMTRSSAAGDRSTSPTASTLT